MATQTDVNLRPLRDQAKRLAVDSSVDGADHMADDPWPHCLLHCSWAFQSQSGTIRTVVTKTYPLSQAADAWKAQMSGHTRGKVVLTVAG